MNISIIGGDLRQLTLARILAKDGYTVKVAGFDKNPDGNSGTAADIWESEVIILPVPAAGDGMTVYAPFSAEPIVLREENLKNARLVLGGNINKSLACFLSSVGIKYIDYLKREELQIKNALPTAEGAVELAFSELPITLASSRCLVVGYGRIGKILARLLQSLGAEVTVSARKCSDLAWISVSGLKPAKTAELSGMIKDYDVIFNTVPAMVLDEAVLKEADPKTLIIDLASKPGGADMLGIKIREGWKCVVKGFAPVHRPPTTASHYLFSSINALISFSASRISSANSAAVTLIAPCPKIIICSRLSEVATRTL